MTTYNATFTGRTRGAIGKFYPIRTTVSGENKEKARHNLYDRYEHISNLTLKVKKRK